jgi:hypothetical protein
MFICITAKDYTEIACMEIHLMHKDDLFYRFFVPSAAA